MILHNSILCKLVIFLCYFKCISLYILKEDVISYRLLLKTEQIITSVLLQNNMEIYFMLQLWQTVHILLALSLEQESSK